MGSRYANVMQQIQDGTFDSHGNIAWETKLRSSASVGDILHVYDSHLTYYFSHSPFLTYSLFDSQGTKRVSHFHPNSRLFRNTGGIDSNSNQSIGKASTGVESSDLESDSDSDSDSFIFEENDAKTLSTQSIQTLETNTGLQLPPQPSKNSVESLFVDVKPEVASVLLLRLYREHPSVFIQIAKSEANSDPAIRAIIDKMNEES